MKKGLKKTKLEENLINSMKAIDKQISREMQRSPDKRSEMGVQKWEPYSKRIELIAGMAIDEFGSDNISLDSLIVLSQAMTKSLQIIMEDLGAEGLGSVRTAYCRETIRQISDSTHKALQAIDDGYEIQ